MEIMTKVETAEFLRVKPRTVSNWLNRNFKDFKDTARRIGDGKGADVRFIRSKVEEWLLKQCA